MKMHFRTFKIKFFVILSIICSVNTSDATTASEVFQKCRIRVLSQDITLFNNFIFSKGTSFPATDSSNSIIYAKRKAKHRAFLILSNYLITPKLKTGTHLTDYLSNKLAKKLHQELVKSKSSKLIKVSGVSTVYSDFDGTCATVVVGARKQKIEHLKTSAKLDFNHLLKDRICVENSEFDPFLAYEICPEIDGLTYIRKAIKMHFDKNYGSNVAKIINSEPIENFFDIWRNRYEYRNKLNHSTLKNLSLDEILFFLNEMPYDPLISYAASEKFRQSGFIKTACLFNNAGTKLFYSEKKLAINYDHLASCTTSDSVNDIQFIMTISPAISEAYSASNIQFPYEAEFIIKSIGTIPSSETRTISKFYYEGNRFFQNNHFQKALEAYFYALEDTLSADLLNMIGMTLIRLNNHKLAIPFLKQALYFNPHHKFAEVNLVEALSLSNFKKLALQCLESAKQNPNLDEWGNHKLKLLNRIL